MPVLSHFDSVQAKPGASFNAKSTYGFAGKLHTAVQQNFHGLGALKNAPAAVEAIKAQVLKNQHLIRKGGLSKYQAEKMIAKIHHETSMKGEHLSVAEKEALETLGHHLTKQVIRRAPSTTQEPERHGITSLGATQHSASVSQMGDQTRVISGQTPRAAGGIASLIKNKNLPTTGPTSSKPLRPPSIKLSI